MQGTTQRIGRMLALGLAGAAVLTGGAHAGGAQDGRSGSLRVDNAQVVGLSPDAFERAVRRNVAAASETDAFERAVLRSSTVPLRPDDRAGIRGPGAEASPQPAAPSADSGFQWGDALFGAAFMLGLGVLAGAATLAVRGRGRIILP
jgi:hypothetical protein